MPLNKLASFRYRVIDQCLRRYGKKWKLEELRSEISEQLQENFGIRRGISRRTLFSDIQIMRSEPPRGFDAPIVCRNGEYFYEDPDYSILKRQLTDHDVEQIKQAISILKQFKGLPHFRGLEEIIQKLEGQLQTNRNPDIVYFDININVAGTEWLEKIYHSIITKTALEVEYQSFWSEKPKLELVHPYLLKEYSNRWYLLGYNETLNYISHYALDRIKGIKKSVKEYVNNTFIDPETYFNDIVGVSIPAGTEPKSIVFRACAEQTPYLKTKPIHQSQVVLKENKDCTIFKIHVIPNFELEQVFLSFGERVQVSEPTSFREKIRTRLNAATDAYGL